MATNVHANCPRGDPARPCGCMTQTEKTDPREFYNLRGRCLDRASFEDFVAQLKETPMSTRDPPLLLHPTLAADAGFKIDAPARTRLAWDEPVIDEALQHAFLSKAPKVTWYSLDNPRTRGFQQVQLEVIVDGRPRQDEAAAQAVVAAADNLIADLVRAHPQLMTVSSPRFDGDAFGLIAAGSAGSQSLLMNRTLLSDIVMHASFIVDPVTTREDILKGSIGSVNQGLLGLCTASGQMLVPEAVGPDEAIVLEAVEVAVDVIRLPDPTVRQVTLAVRVHGPVRWLRQA